MLRIMVASPGTHPADASLGHPLCRKRQRGFCFPYKKNPLCAAGGERVVDPLASGNDRLSRLATLLYIEPVTSPSAQAYAIWHAGAVRSREPGGRVE
jgi:hypothetical protein